MAKITPRHSVQQDVYHDQDNCPYLPKITNENVRQGKGDRKQCEDCKRIEAGL